MAWKKAAEELTKLHAELSAPYPGEKRKMFGCQVFFINDNMYTGVYEDGIIVRLSPEDREAILCERDEAAQFTPNGRAMREYIFLPGPLLDDAEFASKWMERAYRYTATLPPKVKKPKKSRSE